MNLQVIIILGIVCVILISLVVFEIYLTIIIKRLLSIINEQSRVIYLLDKKSNRIESSIDNTQTSIVSLSTSVAKVASNYKQTLETKIHPTPELVGQITKTIQDLLSIEVILSEDLRISKKESVQLIVENVIKTYPNVDVEYLTKKAIAIIESYTRQ